MKKRRVRNEKISAEILNQLRIKRANFLYKPLSYLKFTYKDNGTRYNFTSIPYEFSFGSYITFAIISVRFHNTKHYEFHFYICNLNLELSEENIDNVVNKFQKTISKITGVNKIKFDKPFTEIYTKSLISQIRSYTLRSRFRKKLLENGWKLENKRLVWNVGNEEKKTIRR